MENFKFILISIIVIAGMSVLGYWAFRTIELGDTHVSKERQAELETQNQKLKEEVAKLKSDLAALQPPAETAPTITPVNKPVETLSKYQDLIDALQKMITQKIIVKQKSINANVGTIQTVLNLYNNTSKKVDNEFGPGTKTDVMNFQKAEGLPVTGEAGSMTFQKMIDWLNKQ